MIMIGPNDKRQEKNVRVAITPKRCELDMQLLLDACRKSYKGSPTAPLALTLSDIERSNSMSHRFLRPLSRKGAQLGPVTIKH